MATLPGLGSPMDWGPWRAVLSGVSKSPARPKLLTLTSHTTSITSFVLLFFPPVAYSFQHVLTPRGRQF